MDEEGFIAAAPYKIEALLESVVQGAVPEGVDDMEGACQAKGVVKERPP
jgi:hypothetical protein